MMDEFIHWLKPYLLFLVACDEILSWVIEIWMKNHLVNEGICNIVRLYYPQNFTRNDKYCWVNIQCW